MNLDPLHPSFSQNPSAIESRARRAARRVGFIAKKSRWRVNTVDNFGGFTLVDERTNLVVAGTRFELTAEDIIQYCHEAELTNTRVIV